MVFKQRYILHLHSIRRRIHDGYVVYVPDSMRADFRSMSNISAVIYSAVLNATSSLKRLGVCFSWRLHSVRLTR